MLHQRFPSLFTNPLIAQFLSSLAPTPRAHLATLSPEQREKEETARVARQRPLLRVCSELALVGIISDGAGKSGGEWIMKILKELVRALCRSVGLGFLSGISQLSNDPSLSSLPLLSTFLKSYGRPYLGLTFPGAAGSQVSASETPGNLSANTQIASLGATASSTEENELVEKETRERLKRMCEGYFDTISKKLVKEHLVCIFMCCSGSPDLGVFCRNFKSRTAVIMRLTSDLAKYLKTVSKLMRK